jgi:hypothetical protein
MVTSTGIYWLTYGGKRHCRVTGADALDMIDNGTRATFESVI